MWHGDIVWCHKVKGIKGGTTDKTREEQCFLWVERSEETGASEGVDLFNFKDIWHAITFYNTEGKESTQKAQKASFKINYSCGTKNYLMCKGVHI